MLSDKEASGVLRLDVGGHRFATTRDTLSASGFFRAMLGGKWLSRGSVYVPHEPMFGIEISSMPYVGQRNPNKRVNEVSQTRRVRRDAEGAIFVDRDGEHFALLLSFCAFRGVVVRHVGASARRSGGRRCFDRGRGARVEGAQGGPLLRARAQAAARCCA